MPDWPEPGAEALGWWALQFTPRVGRQGGALLLDVSPSLRLWGGLGALQARLAATQPAEAATLRQAAAASGLVALAQVRLARAGQAVPADSPAALPLPTLDAARPHLDVLARLGCHTWGQAHALPRGGLVQRFGPALRHALDVAWGQAAESYPWLALPERFDQTLALPARADSAPALIWAAQRLLAALQTWLRVRQLGVRAIELGWRPDGRRQPGAAPPPEQWLPVRTAEPVQDMAHLSRLLTERLAHTAMHAPTQQLRLRATDTTPWRAASASWLPDAPREGEARHAFIERVSARLGAAAVLAPVAHADHRPERAQSWQPATHMPPGGGRGADGGAAAARARSQERPGKTDEKAARKATPEVTEAAEAATQDAAHEDACEPLPDAPAVPADAHAHADPLAPTWLLRPPQPLAVQGGQPQHHGPLRLLAGPRRVEAGWWATAQPGQGEAVARDYFIAQNAAHALLWVYRERPTRQQRGADAAERWFLHGWYG